MRYYWEALFSVEYFPYWEFTMLMMMIMQCSMIYRLAKMDDKQNQQDELLHHIIDEVEGT
tara:strand:+ start:1879 stop:2058 length:180 start_codon:yes stop_codon:yes gene_type:complete